MKEWIKASKEFPVEGNPESLIGKHCRWSNTGWPFQFLSLGEFGNFRYCMEGQCKSQYVNDCIDNIEWLLETEEEPKTNNDSKVYSDNGLEDFPDERKVLRAMAKYLKRLSRVSDSRLYDVKAGLMTTKSQIDIIIDKITPRILEEKKKHDEFRKQ